MQNVKEIEVFYRGLAMLGMVIVGEEHEEIPELAKALASRMMEDSPAKGIVAAKPRKYTRK
jgi:hypothetical protein